MKKFKNLLAIAMVFVMLVAVMPINVFAEGDGTVVANPTDQNDQDPPVEIKVTFNKNQHGDNVCIYLC